MSQTGVASADRGLFDLGIRYVEDFGPEVPRDRWLIEFHCLCYRWLSRTGLIRSPCVHLRAC